MAALSEGRYAEAITLLRTAAAADPLTATAPTVGGIRDGAAALRTGALSAAISHFTDAIAVEPKSSEAHRLAGMAYWADEQYDRSIDHLQKSIVLNASDDRARAALGGVFAAAGRVADAEQALRDAVRAVPASGLAQYRLGRLRYDFPDMWPDATSALEATIRLHPVIGSDLLYQMVTHMHLIALNLDAAVDASTRRIEANPNDAEAYRVLGDAYVQQGRDRDAIPQFLAALLVQPRDAVSWGALAQRQLRIGEYAAAEFSARHAIEIDSTRGGAQFALKNAVVRLGRADEGAKELERFQRMQSEAQAREAREWELKMLNQDASASLQNGEQEQAIRSLRAAVALAPEVASGYLSLGVVLKSIGRHAEGIEQFRKSLELNADPTACGLLAESYGAIGQANEAARYRSDCVRLKEERVKNRLFKF
jgi:tetratricopeptide (TPR) repeat protein